MKVRLVKISTFIFVVSLYSTVQAADLAGYAKLGYLYWQETVYGQKYISENGPTLELGLRSTNQYSWIALNNEIGIWGSVLSYDGSTLNDDSKLTMTTGDAGLKYNFTVSVPERIASETVIAPWISGGVNYFQRFMGPEEWVVWNARMGLRMAMAKYELNVGILYPFKTTDRCDWRSEGAANAVVIEPKGKVTPLVEFMYALNEQFRMGLYYEEWKWADSNAAPFTYTSTNYASLLARDSYVFQPRTDVVNAGITFQYHF